MKNCEEMTNSLIERRDEYLAEQKKKRKNLKKRLNDRKPVLKRLT